MFTCVFYALVHIPLFFCPAARESEGRGWHACQEQPGQQGDSREVAEWPGLDCRPVLLQGMVLPDPQVFQENPSPKHLFYVKSDVSMLAMDSRLKNHYVYQTKINLQIVPMGCQLRLPNC